MLSSTLYLSFIVLTALVSVGLFHAYLRGGKQNKYLKNFSIFFALFAFYRFFLSAYFFTESLEVASHGYNIAILIFFGMVVIVMDIPLSMLGFSSKDKKIAEKSMLLLGAMVVAIQFADPRLPTIHPSGIVVWNSNPLAYLITSLAGFLVGMLWVYTFGKNFKNNLSTFEKTKTILIIFSAFFTALSALTHYYPNYYSVLFSFGAAFLGCVSILAAVAMFYMKSQK